MKIALIPQPSIEDVYLERKQREHIAYLLAQLKKEVGQGSRTRVACSQRRLAREISYLVVEEFGECPTIIYPWLNEENLFRLNDHHIEAVSEYIRSQDADIMTIVLPQPALAAFIHFFDNIKGVKSDPAVSDTTEGLILIDTDSKGTHRIIS